MWQQKGSLAVLLGWGVGVLCGFGGPQVFAESRLSNSVQERVATGVLRLLGGAARGYIKVTVAETRIAEWPQVHEVQLWVEQTNGLHSPMLLYASPDGKYLFWGALIQADTLEDLTQARQQRFLPRYDLKRINFAQGHVRGNPGAPLRLVEFSDFQCPFCARLQPVLERLLGDYSGKVVHYFKHAPLTGIHPLASRFHQAAECAARQREEAFWVFHKRFFTTQTAEWDVATIRKTTEAWAQELKLDAAPVLACFDNQSTAEIVQKNLAEFPVKATPTLLVGDEVVEGVVPYDELKAVVERKLREKR